jgi:hypothetical protein
MTGGLRIRHDGDRVQLIVDGVCVANMPWDAALEVSAIIKSQAKSAEQYAKAHTVIYDHAILLRAGAPVGLSSDPRMIDEAAKLAAWDTSLRRYMPGGVKSSEAFGVPMVANHGV